MQSHCKWLDKIKNQPENLFRVHSPELTVGRGLDGMPFEVGQVKQGNQAELKSRDLVAFTRWSDDRSVFAAPASLSAPPVRVSGKKVASFCGLVCLISSWA